MTGTITPDLLLDRAADLLDEKGWCRQQEETTAGQHCLVGALRAAAIDLDCESIAEACRSLRAELGHEGARNNFPLVFFNDNVAKDKRYVTRLLRRAARRFRGATS